MIVFRTVRLLLFLFGIGFFSASLSQSRESKIANEYFNKRDYEKSYEYYKKLIKVNEERNEIYDNYISCLRKLDEQKSGIKTLNKLISANAYALDYKIDKAILTRDLGKRSWL